MSGYELYVFFLCLIVFIVLTATFSLMLTIVMKSTLKLIIKGVEDDKIKEEYIKNSKKSKKIDIASYVVSLLLCIFLLGIFVFSIAINVRGNSYFDNVPTFKVVNSDSMSKKHDKNTYLVENKLNDQFQTFDLLLVYKAPQEKDIKLYDVVVYEVNNMQVIHRVVGIEEPNANHPNERYFLCRGDANESSDRFPVLYSQIKAIYRGERVPFIGSFVSFLQSPAGWMCIALVVFAVVGAPFLEKKLSKTKLARLTEIGYFDESEAVVTAVEPLPETITPLTAVQIIEEKISENTTFTAPRLTFAQKLLGADEFIKDAYKKIVTEILVCSKLKERVSARHQNFYCGRKAVARLAIRRGYLYVYLSVDNSNFAENDRLVKHTPKGLADKFPVYLKITSNRKINKALELIGKNNKALIESGAITQRDLLKPAYYDFDLAFGIKSDRSFIEKLNFAPIETQKRYKEIVDYATANEGVVLKESKKYHSLKKNGKGLARIAFRGKALRVYFAINPKNIENSEYKFTDVSNVKAYKNYPVLIKITSEKRVLVAKELFDETL